MKHLLVGIIALFGSVQVLGQGDEKLSEIYLQKMQDDIANRQQWSLCAAAAMSKEKYSEEQFKSYALKTVASLKLLNPEKKDCPCPDVLEKYWDPENNSSSGDKANANGKTNQGSKKSNSMVGSTPAIPPPLNSDENTGPPNPVFVEKVQIPDFVSGTNLLIPYTFRGTRQGVYMAFLTVPDDPLKAGSIKTHVYKFCGATWSKSTQRAAILSIWPHSSKYEQGHELDYDWTGAADLSDPNRVVGMNNSTTLATYSNHGQSFADENPPAQLWKITTCAKEGFFAGDVWAIGGPPFDNLLPDNLFELFLYRQTGSYKQEKGNVFEKVSLSQYINFETAMEIQLEGSIRKGDHHAWIGAGNKLIKANAPSQEKFIVSELNGIITKIRVQEDFTWVLAGSNLYRIDNNDNLRLIYTIQSTSPCFAVGGGYVYTNDGNKFPTGLTTLNEPILGTGPSPNSEIEYTALKQSMNGLLMELTDGDNDLYFLNPATGTIYVLPHP